MKEKWVQICQIQGFEEIRSCYWISNSDKDKIINRDTEKQLKIGSDGRGYLRVSLITVDGKYKHCRIHVLKASAFLYIPNPISYNVVRHLNDVKTDNRIPNLAWGTQSQNAKDCIRNGNFNYSAAARGGVITAAKSAVINGKKTGAKNGKKKSKPVRCIETGTIYASAKEAERKTGIVNANINACCRGIRHTAKGLHWEFVNKEVNKNDMECEQIR